MPTQPMTMSKERKKQGNDRIIMHVRSFQSNKIAAVRNWRCCAPVHVIALISIIGHGFALNHD